MTTFDPTPYLSQPEGQYFDRKSLWEGREGSKRNRDRRTVRDQIAKYIAAFANADGGVLILGLEDDGSVTGHGYSDKAIQTFLQTSTSRLNPPQPAGVVIDFEGQQLIVFDVPISSVPVQVIGDGFPLRYGDQVVQASETMIQQTKFVGLVESFEAQPSRLQLDDLDEASIQQAKKGAGLGAPQPCRIFASSTTGGAKRSQSQTASGGRVAVWYGHARTSQFWLANLFCFWN